MFSSSLVDSIHGGSGHEGMLLLEQQYQLFASEGAIRFPIEPVTEAWTEKVCHLKKYSTENFISEVNLMICLHFFFFYFCRLIGFIYFLQQKNLQWMYHLT